MFYCTALLIVFISINLDLLDKMWTYLKLVRIYTKPKVGRN